MTVVILSRSFAWVQRATAEYSPAPSLWKLITRFVGQAKAAPTESVGPEPMAPPVSTSWEKGWQPAEAEK